MPYTKTPRPYKREWALEQKRNEKPARAARARSRRELDSEGISRVGKVIDHIKPLSKGGSDAKSNLRLVSRERNASFDRNSDGSVRKNEPMKKGRK